MNYTQILPPESLRAYVRYFALLESDGAGNTATKYKIIVDGCPGLIFQENPNGFLHKNKQTLPQLFLHGLSTKHAEKTTTGAYRNMGVYFRPHAVKAIFGIDAHELTNHYVDLDAVIKSNITEQLLHENSTEKRIGILSNFLLQQINRNSKKENPAITFAINTIQEEKTTSLDRMQKALNVTERTLERLFKSNVGVSPKLFLRIHRFQQALDYVRKQNFQSLTELAYELYYADQSHYIREFKEFSGVSPRQFLQQANEQALNFPEWK